MPEYGREYKRAWSSTPPSFLSGNAVAFSLPVHGQRFQRVLERQHVSRWQDEDDVYRVAWRNMQDWILAQFALYETQIVDMPQIFLTFATDAKGQTLSQQVIEGKFLLGDGRQE